MNRGRIKITSELLKESLQLPDDFILTGVKYDFDHETIEIFGTTEEFDYCSEGACSPLHTLKYKNVMHITREFTGMERM